MSFSTSLLDSAGETVVHKILEKHRARFAVHTGVRFFRVIDYHLAGLTEGERAYLNTTEFDFVVCEGPRLRPIFAVEYDGIGSDFAKFDNKRPWKMATKRKACEIAGFPLLWLEPLSFIEGVSILDAAIESYRGGAAVAKMVEQGELSWEESFIYDFPPLARMRRKYGGFKAGNQIVTDFGEFDAVTQKMRYRTDQGIIEIEKRGRVRALRFPFFHGIELASDIAQYRCYVEFAARLNRGEFSVKGIVESWRAAAERWKQSQAKT